MASTSTPAESKQGFVFLNISFFPSVINGRINITKFLNAASDLLGLVERLGKVFAPVKYDMQGNIDKIKKHFKFNEESCLLELMLEEKSRKEHIGTESVLWLNRALHFFELVFQEIIVALQADNYDINMKDVFTVAYEGSVKKYHNWITQQLFTIICKMSPTFPQITKSLEVENEIKSFESILTNFNVTLHLVRCKIDDFMNDNNIVS
ncbi:glycolipid transfer protein [Epargyreus clarus]|uniref:glycolipid transfer protein n=1 Tax=Epargyreus clarus TaxID=520877 RepID=UPI003C2F2019